MKLTMNKLLQNLLFKPWKHGTDIALLIIRLVVGLSLFFGHGMGKLIVLFGGHEIQFLDPIGLGPKFSFVLVAFAEGIASLLLAVGLFSRLAAMVLSFNFLIIIYMHLGVFGDPISAIEMVILYFAIFVAFIFVLPGEFSLDNVLFNKKK